MFDPQILIRPGTVLLDSARPDAENQWSWGFTTPQRVLTATTADEVSDFVEALETTTNRGKYVAGYLSYEAGYPFVDLHIPRRAEQPLAWFGVYDAPHRFAPRDADRKSVV